MPARRKVMIVAAALVLGTTAAVQMSGQAEALLQKAVQAETVDGDLQAAIALYEKAVAAAGSNRGVAARALVQMGECYEKMGDAGARKAYERVVQDYADQAEQLKLARARLATLAAASTQAPEKPLFRKIGFPFRLTQGSKSWPTFGAALSPDGKVFALSSEDAIWLVPAEGKVSPGIAGEARRLTPPMGAAGDGLAWSADGNWIAFFGDGGIYVVALREGEPRRVAYQPPTGRATGQADSSRLSLSPDGRVLAFTSVGEDGNLCVATVPTDGGVPRCITDPMSGDPAFSPDGRNIVYIQALNRTSSEVRVIPVGGGRSAIVAKVPERAANPFWSPDGRMVAFLLAPAGHNDTEELWIVPVSETGTSTGSPTSIKLPRKTTGPLLGWGVGNRIGIQFVSPFRSAIYTVPASGGKATQVTPEQVAQDGEKFDFPRWTPDGKRIWFLDSSIPNALGHVPAGGGTVTNVRTGSNPPVQDVPPGGGNVISPDGKRVVFAGYPRQGATLVGIWTMSLEGGQPTLLTQPPPLSRPGQDRFPCWTPDGKAILFIRLEGWQDTWYASTNVYIAPAEGGEARPITSASDKVAYGGIACSPDGKRVAYFSQDKISRASPVADTIKIKPLDGGEARVVARVAHTGGHEEISWSPDSRKLAFNAKGKLWAVSLDGGAPVEIKTGLEEGWQMHVAWSPDGDKIAFTGMRGNEPELWLMEDFLPLITKAR